MIFVVGDPIIHRVNRKKGKVIEVNNYWGWFKVEYEDGHVREYQGIMRRHETTVMLDLDRNV